MLNLPTCFKPVFTLLLFINFNQAGAQSDNKGDWSLELGKSYFDRLLFQNGELYGYTSNTSGKIPEIFRIRNHTAERLLGAQEIDAKGDYFKVYFDQQSGIYILYHLKGEMEQIRKWNGSRMEEYADNKGQSLHVLNLFIDPQQQIIGECREKMIGEFGPLVILKKGAWTSAGLQLVKGFSEKDDRKQYKSDAAGNLYAFTSAAIARWNGKNWTAIDISGISGGIQDILFNEENELHILLKGEKEAKLGKVYRQNKTSWTEIKLDTDFFTQINSNYVRLELAGKDQVFAQVSLKTKNASGNDYPVYWWRKNAWVNILEQRSYVAADNNSFWVYGYGKNLYMNNYKQRLVLKWDPSAIAPAVATVTKPVSPPPAVNPPKPVNPAPVITKTEPVKTAEPKAGETQIKQVGNYYIFRANGKYGVQEGYLRTVNKLEATYDTITGFQIKEGNKLKALFVVINQYGLQVFDPETMKFYRTASTITEYWHTDEELWLKTSFGKWYRYPDPVSLAAGMQKLQYINNSLITYPDIEAFRVSAWKYHRSGTIQTYLLIPGAEVVDFDYAKEGRYTYQLKGKFGYSDWDNLLFLPMIFSDMKMWRTGTTVYLQFSYNGELYQTTADDLKRPGSGMYANIKAFQYSASCGKTGCNNGIIGYNTQTIGGKPEKRTYKKLTTNGWIEITETSISPIVSKKEAIRCNDPAHSYKTFMLLPLDNGSGYEVHRMK